MAPRDDDDADEDKEDKAFKKAGEEKEEEEEGDSEDDGEEEEEEDEEGGEMVGCLEAPPSDKEKKLLTRLNFPSKVGGKPAWLVPQGLPDLACRKCSNPMRFLLQVYASRGEQRADAFHRAVHLFFCSNCQPNEVRAFRVQLPRHDNGFYSPDPPVEKQVIKKAYNDPELEKITCWDCGLSLPLKVDTDASGSSGSKKKKKSEEEAEDASKAGEQKAGGGYEAASAPVAQAEEDEEVEEVVRADLEPAVEEVEEVGNRCKECTRRIRLGDGPAMLQERELTTSEAVLPDYDDEEEEVGPMQSAAMAAAAAGAESDESLRALRRSSAWDSEQEKKSPPTSKLAAVDEEAEQQVPDVNAAGASAGGVLTTEEDALAGIDAAIASHVSREGVQDDSDEVTKKLKEFRERVSKDPSESAEDCYDDMAQERGGKDATFARFQRFSAENKAHVLRYAWDGKPLWFCSKAKLKAEPPPCARCGKPRVFEMQVQPQLIALLGDDRATEPLARRLDYGTIVVYVCSDSCEAAASAAEASPTVGPYAEEFVYVQPEPGDAWLPSPT